MFWLTITSPPWPTATARSPFSFRPVTFRPPSESTSATPIVPSRTGASRFQAPARTPVSGSLKSPASHDGFRVAGHRLPGPPAVERREQPARERVAAVAGRDAVAVAEELDDVQAGHAVAS